MHPLKSLLQQQNNYGNTNTIQGEIVFAVNQVLSKISQHFLQLTQIHRRVTTRLQIT